MARQTAAQGDDGPVAGQADSMQEQPPAPYRQALDLLPHIVWIAGRDGTPAYFNQRWYEYTGLTAAQRCHWEQALQDADREPYRDRVRQAIEAGAGMQIESRLRGSDGISRWHRVALAPLRDAAGVLTGWVGSANPIDEQRRLEAALRASREGFRLLFAAHPEPMWVFDLATLRFLEVNEAAVRQYGYTRDEFLAMRLVDLLAPGEGTRLEQEVALVARENLIAVPWRHRRRDGRIIEVEATSQPLEFGGRMAVIAGARDVTDRVRGAARLALQHAVTSVLSTAATLDAALPPLLETIGMHLGWDLGAYWATDTGAGVLRCRALWQRPGAHADAFAAHCLECVFTPGAGIPGRVWADGVPTLIPDVLTDPDFLRGQVAAGERLHGEVGFPIASGGEVHGVMEFFSHEIADLDPVLMPTLAALGAQIGGFIERKRVEDERTTLLANEQTLRAAAAARAAHLEATFEAMADGVFVCDPAGHILQTNGAFRALMGIDHGADYERYTLDERAARLLFRYETGEPLPVDRWPVQRILRGEILRGESAIHVLVRTLDDRDILLHVTGAPVYDAAGQLIAGVCVCRDVTDQRRLERRTQDALDALIAMAEAVVLTPVAMAAEVSAERAGAATSIAGGRLAELTRRVLGCRHVAIVSVPGQTDELHPVAVAGFSEEEVAGWWRQWDSTSRLADRLTPVQIAQLRSDDVLVADRSKPPFSSATAFGRRIVLMVPLQVRGGLSGILSVDYGEQAHTYTPDDIALVRAVGRLLALVFERERLVLERAEARASVLALQEANRRMDEFLGIAGHEMRTPLTASIGTLQLAQRRLARLQAEQGSRDEATLRMVAETDRTLERLDVQLHRLNRLVGDLLDVSRIHAGRLEMHLEPCDLPAVVLEVVEDQRQVVPDRTVKLEIAVAEPVIVQADSGRIGQVLLNYLSNAFRYSPPGLPVTVGLRVDEHPAIPDDVAAGDEGHASLSSRWARVWVRDAGPGLPPDLQERVWERFYRAQGGGVRDSSVAGLGLGLHICRTIIERHGGRVGLDSTPGEGATFWFALPLAPQPPAEQDVSL